MYQIKGLRMSWNSAVFQSITHFIKHDNCDTMYLGHFERISTHWVKICAKSKWGSATKTGCNFGCRFLIFAQICFLRIFWWINDAMPTLCHWGSRKTLKINFVELFGKSKKFYSRQPIFIRININMIYISYNGRIWDFFLNFLHKLRKHSFTTLNRNNTTEMHLSERP